MHGEGLLDLASIPLPDNIPLPKEKPPTLNPDDTHESIISLLSLPSNVGPPPPPPGIIVRLQNLKLIYLKLI